MYRYQPIPFTPLAYIKKQGIHKKFILLWLLACMVIIPSGMITRIFELTGIPFSLFDIDFHVTIYFPLLICIPLCLCFGFIWAAIPAYFSTFFVALIGDMPMHWIIVFSFANPIGLAVMIMVYRITPTRIDFKTKHSLLFFIILSFLSALSGSIGSFIWTYTNQINLHDFFRVWQGWWLGGFLQSVFICAPLLYFFSSRLLRWRNLLIDPSKLKNSRGTRSEIKFAISVVISIIILYVWLAFQINIMNIEDKLLLVSNDSARQQILEATNVINFPVTVFIFIIIFLGYFFFYFTDYWTLRLQNLNKQLLKINGQLTEQNERMYQQSIHDSLTGIYNRSFFFQKLREQFDIAQSQNTTLVLFIMDLDYFKSINDTYGHQSGDLVLKNFAHGISTIITDDMTFSRVGGEEFCLIVPHYNQQQATDLAEKILDKTRKITTIQAGQEISITTCIGISFLSELCTSIDDLIESADNALYKAKDNGRDQYQVQS